MTGDERYAFGSNLTVKPQVLRTLPLEGVKKLKTELRAALQRCEAHEVELEEGREMCVTCCAAARDVAFSPCGHMAVCVGCLPRLDGRCPICQSHFRSHLRVFRA